ncbi:MAG: hypothetical protein CVV51_05130 [Spirochaetae bacterium HGW-Spirochaetae-7]|jgi:hypothetical protein|nr:MAG: hypothetical protein CVV51_05130 [Spirochaetae bacterium HGW-Spirochaetae-7]
MKIPILLALLPMAAANVAAQGYTISNLGNSPSEDPAWMWESFADTVMGGKSELTPPAVVDADGSKAMLLAGRVVTKGGGFIQVRLRYGKDRFDASAWSGVEVEVDARSETSWHIFLRTRDTLFPWSYYGAPFKPSSSRSTIRIPWSAFEAASTLRKNVRTDSISSVALVAAFEDFNAYLRIYRVGFYK